MYSSLPSVISLYVIKAKTIELKKIKIGLQSRGNARFQTITIFFFFLQKVRFYEHLSSLFFSISNLDRFQRQYAR